MNILKKYKLVISNKQKLLIFSIIAFLCTLIGTTYAWISHDFLGVSQDITITSMSITLNFRGTSEEIIADLAPGENVTKTFAVINNSSTATTYNLFWRNIFNNIPNRNDFYYKIINTDTNAEVISTRYLPSNLQYFKTSIPLAGNTTHNYALIIFYNINLLQNQVDNANKYFYGEISIDNSSIVSPYNRFNYFINGVATPTRPVFDSYTVDTSRTYCTDGTGITVGSNDVALQNMVDTTTCDIYLTTSTTPLAFTEPPYNLLHTNLERGQVPIGFENYYYEDDVIELTIPTKSGSAFTGWTVVGNGASVTPTATGYNLTMGSTYTYLKANWADGKHYVKTTQTCSRTTVATYTRTYKTCAHVVQNTTQTIQTCRSRTFQYWRRKTQECYCPQVNSCSWINTNYEYDLPSCTESGSSVCNVNTISPISVTCTVTGSSTVYEWNPTTASSIVAAGTCSPVSTNCSNSSDVGNQYITCTDNYIYDWSSVVTDSSKPSSCIISNFACNSSTENDQYTTSCTPYSYNYGYTPTTSNATDCAVLTAPVCNSDANVGNTYVSACTLVNN